MESIKKLAIFVFIVALLVNAVSADLVISREANTRIILGEQVSVSIKIVNDYDSETFIFVKEQLSPDLELVDPKKPSYTITKVNIPILTWNEKLAPKEKKVITYTIKPNILGKFSILPTEIRDESREELYFAEVLTLNVLCIPDSSCNGFENHINCPADCPSGSADNVCDFRIDGVCDPDCEPDSDIDCKKEESKKEIGFSISILFLNNPIMTLLIAFALLVLFSYGIYMLTKKKSNGI